MRGLFIILAIVSLDGLSAVTPGYYDLERIIAVLPLQGLQDSDLLSFGESAVRESQNTNYEEHLCVICLNCIQEADEADVMRLGPCGHIFHHNCIENWFEKGKPNCPTCRQNVEVKAPLFKIRNKSRFAIASVLLFGAGYLFFDILRCSWLHIAAHDPVGRLLILGLLVISGSLFAISSGSEWSTLYQDFVDSDHNIAGFDRTF
jgi:hypothetical protein